MYKKVVSTQKGLFWPFTKTIRDLLYKLWDEGKRTFTTDLRTFSSSFVNNLNVPIDCSLWFGFEKGIFQGSHTGSAYENAYFAQFLVRRGNKTGLTLSPTRTVETPFPL